VTAVVGLWCEDAFVICADQQFTAPGFYKYYDCKITTVEGSNWKAVLAYSGLPDCFEKFKEIILANMKPDKSDLTPATVYSFVESALEKMGCPNAETGIQLLVATSTNTEIEVIRSDGKYPYITDRKMPHCLGVGDSSLLKFLSDTMYAPDMDIASGVKLGIYLTKKATKYVDGCGGQIDVIILKRGCKHIKLPLMHARWIAAELELNEKAHLQKVFEIRGSIEKCLAEDLQRLNNL
jgi:20S proteasome alpha/beta subunit